MPQRPLSRRALNRATLARQMLLVREKATPAQAMERLAGLQAQLPRPPFVGLWSRLRGFERDELKRAVLRRTVVRGTLMRGTLHLVTARDFLKIRPALQPALDKVLSSVLRGRARSLDLERLLALARDSFLEKPRTFDDLRGFLAKRYPTDDVRAMAYAIRLKLPLLQVP